MTQTNRAVRVFISSTFRDMHAEREELVKYTFPELRRRCRARGVEFLDVDLRWGVTDEQKAEGQVLPICLAEIERCRPYFIGLLGERYGWIPDTIDQDLIEEQPWLREHRAKSVTDLEILHGVLQNPDMSGAACFYFRDPQTSKQIEAELSGAVEYQAEPEASRSKLDDLKARIYHSGFPLRTDYPDARTVGQWVLEDLWNAIDQRFPEEETPTPLERTRMEHEAFADVRRKVYLGRPEYFETLDRHVAGEGPPLVLLGDSGAGKSALLANWAEQYRIKQPGDFLLCHFIGSTADSADYVQLLRRIMQEIQERYESTEKLSIDGQSPPSDIRELNGDKIPTDPRKVVEAFPLWLEKAAAKGRLVLVLDALNQLEDRDNALELGWLPNYYPANIRIILSTLPGRSLDNVKKREWNTLSIQPIELAERKQFIQMYLKQYRKALAPIHADRIAMKEQSSNPLYLRTLLEELRVFGKHEELDERISYYLKAGAVDDLFERVLDRLETDYEQEAEHKGLVKKVMSLLWASRRGLYEVEILELIDQPVAVWSPLYLALEESLVNRSGLLSFFHDFLRKAVEDRYLDNEESKRETHLILADYFVVKTLDERKVDELPWQLLQAEHWQGLKDCISDLKLFSMLDDYELIGYWQGLGNRYDMETEYINALNCFDDSQPGNVAVGVMATNLALFFYTYGFYSAGENFARKAILAHEEQTASDDPHLAIMIQALALILREKGEYEESEDLFRKALSLLERTVGLENSNTAWTMNLLGDLLVKKSNYDEAERLLRKAIDIQSTIMDRNNYRLASTSYNLGKLLIEKDDYEGAEPLLRRALYLAENELGASHRDTIGIMHGLGTLLIYKGDYEVAEPLLRRAVAGFEKVLGAEHPDTAEGLKALAGLLHDKGDYEEAELLYRKAISISEKVLGAKHPYMAIDLSNLAAMLQDKGDYEEAELLYRRAISISEKVLGAKHPDTARMLHNLAGLLLCKGDYDGMVPLYRHALEIYEHSVNQSLTTVPKIQSRIAVCHNQIAFWGDVPTKNWKSAESHYHKAMELFHNTEQPIEAANAELNLQTLYQLYGQAVDLQRVSELTRLLEKAGDQRAEKGKKLLQEIHA